MYAQQTYDMLAAFLFFEKRFSSNCFGFLFDQPEMGKVLPCLTDVFVQFNFIEEIFFLHVASSLFTCSKATVAATALRWVRCASVRKQTTLVKNFQNPRTYVQVM